MWKKLALIGLFIVVILLGVLGFVAYRLLTLPEEARQLEKRAERLASAPVPARDLAKKVESVLEPLSREPRTQQAPSLSEGQAIKISEEEINAYILTRLQEKHPRGVRHILVTLKEGKVIVEGLVDLDQIPISEKVGVAEPIRQALSGTQYVILEGGVTASGGGLRIDLTRAQVNNLALPVSVVSEFLSKIGRKQKTPFELGRSFPLPGNIRDVEVHEHYLLLRTP